MRVGILDGYVDEPANFGVPPYLAPQLRYVAGACYAAGAEVDYATIDAYRTHADARAKIHAADLVVLYAAALVPGNYLRGAPIEFSEAQAVAKKCAGKTVLAGSCAVYGFSRGGGMRPGGRGQLKPYLAGMSTLDADAYVWDFLRGRSAAPAAVGAAFEEYGRPPPSSAFVDARGTALVQVQDATGLPVQRRRTLREWERFALAGARLVHQHPDFPHPLVAEVETYTGCVRYVNGGCKFCMEPREGKPMFRDEPDVIAEVRLLYEAGVRNFRLGGQTCFFCYKTNDLGNGDRPRPNPEAIERLLVGIRRAAPHLRTLHIDNANPAVIATHPKESAQIARLIATHCTSGNVAAFGLESTDPAVATANNLNATPDEVRVAVRLLNEHGGHRGPNGLPTVLPGLNFIAGLAGATSDSHDLDLRFLESLRDEGLMLRRINLRQLLPMTGGMKPITTRARRRFLEFKRQVRTTIDRPLLERMLPLGTRITDVWLETHDGSVTFGRQIGSYPLLVGVPYPLPLEAFTDVVITDYGQRSVTGFHAPFPINQADQRMFESLPTVGARRARRAMDAQPFADPADCLSALGVDDATAGLLVGHLAAS